MLQLQNLAVSLQGLTFNDRADVSNVLIADGRASPSPGFAWKASLTGCWPQMGFYSKEQFADKTNKTTGSVIVVNRAQPHPSE